MTLARTDRTALTAACILLTVGCVLVQSAPLVSNGAAIATTRPTTERTVVIDAKKAMEYLIRYGHASGSLPVQFVSNSSLEAGLLSLQTFAGIPKTGVLDEATIKLMNTPRCGMPDKHISSHRSKRYAIHSKLWSSNSFPLVWSMIKGPSHPSIPRGEATIIGDAFQMWSNANSRLSFSNVPSLSSSGADVLVGFYSYDHGDGEPFDGPGDTISHFWYPTDGRLHFDDSETWTDKTYSGMNLLHVAAHDTGHVLGLEHSSDQSAVMYPYNVADYVPNLALSADDINAINDAYDWSTGGVKCFPRDSFVISASGRRIAMHDLAVGDRVLTVDVATGQTQFDEVVAFLHRDVNVTSLYVQVQTESGYKVSLTPSHLIYVSDTTSSTDAKMMFADRVRVGQYVFNVGNSTWTDGRTSEVITADKVIWVSTAVRHAGAYGPLTSSGTIVVDGILASCYAIFGSHQLADLAMTPLKLGYYIREFLGLHWFDSSLSCDNNLHCYAAGLQQLAGLHQLVFPGSWWS